ncbi:thioredoxin [Schlesneria paludicola]|uniref:thioredoxin n=1 Tax=Schlesneria paludicola TaxID=360056 RepID=UPI000492B8F7|nr:thioredoxin [Schlesneria paludicola]
MAGNVAEFTDAGFKSDVVDSQQPVLVDFWAPWCGPCKMLGPTIEELANTYSGRVRIGKVNIDDNQQVASDYGISSIPTVMIFKGGQVVDRFVGVTPKAKLSAAIDSHL